MAGASLFSLRDDMAAMTKFVSSKSTAMAENRALMGRVAGVQRMNRADRSGPSCALVHRGLLLGIGGRCLAISLYLRTLLFDLKHHGLPH